MASIIKLTPEIIEEAVASFRHSVEHMRVSSGKISYTRNLVSDPRKAELVFSEKAWYKMCALVSEFPSEIGWHGTARRGDGDSYLVDDIIIYPQNVTGSTVTPDQVAYQNWLMEQPDEIFENIRFQGHSHVNMAVSPSTVDTAFYEEILSQLDDSMFYIFLVINKRGERHVRIYDMAKNLYFGPEEVSVRVCNDHLGIEDVIGEAKSKVVQVTYQYPAKPAKTGASVLPPISEPAKTAPKKKPQPKPFGSEQEKFDEEWYDSYLSDLYGRYGVN